MGREQDTPELPIVTQPGKPGLRQDRDGRIWIPIGLNVVARNETEFFFPKFVERREFEMDRKAAHKRVKGSIRTKLCKCSRCEFFIGQGYHESEVYLNPVLGADTIDWKIVCGGCAEELHLSYGFCLIGHSDWPEPTRQYLQLWWFTAMQRKIRHLEDKLVEAWNAAEYRTMQRYRQKQGTLKGFPRAALWDRFIAMQQPNTLTFAQLFAELQQETGRKIA